MSTMRLQFYVFHLSLTIVFQNLTSILQVLVESIQIQIFVTTVYYSIQLLTKLYFIKQMTVMCIVILLN
jgi:hypothetical protein